MSNFKKVFAIIVLVAVFCIGPIIAIIFCVQLLIMCSYAPHQKLVTRDLCDDILRTIRVASCNQNFDATWISEEDIIIQIKKTYDAKIFAKNCTETISLIIRCWVDSGILNSKIVEDTGKIVYTVVEKKVEELYECS